MILLQSPSVLGGFNLLPLIHNARNAMVTLDTLVVTMPDGWTYIGPSSFAGSSIAETLDISDLYYNGLLAP